MEEVIRSGEVGGRSMAVAPILLPSSQAVDCRRVLCRGVRQRLAKRCKVTEAVRESITALNSIAGYQTEESSEWVDEFSSRVAVSLQQLHEQNAPPLDFSVQESAIEILGAVVTPYGGGWSRPRL